MTSLEAVTALFITCGLLTGRHFFGGERRKLDMFSRGVNLLGFIIPAIIGSAIIIVHFTTGGTPCTP